MKRSVYLFVLILSALCLIGCSGNKKNIVKIGVFEPASGDNGAGGKQETLGIQYANKLTPTVEIDGKEYQVQLEIVDNESSNTKAVQVASELVNKGVSLVLGSYGSGVSIAASDTFANASVPAIGVSCTNPQVTQGNNHYFRICFLDSFQGTVLADFAIDNLKAKKAYCLAKLGDAYSVGLCNYFIDAFRKAGGEIVFETFPEGTSDFASYVVNAKNQAADVFFSPVSIEAASLIIEQVKTQKLSMPILAGDTWDSSLVLEAAQGSNTAVFATTFFIEDSTAKNVTDFVKGFRSYINTDSIARENNGGNDEISAFSAMGFDAYYTALEALKNAGSTNSKDVLKALPSTKYTGLSGFIEFDANGDAKHNLAYIQQVDNATGTWKFIAAQKIR